MNTKIVLFFAVFILTVTSCNLFGDGNNTIGAETLDCQITNDITLTDRNPNGVDYVVNCELDLRADMDIEEGTIIEFKEDAGIHISGSGRINAQGIGGVPVVFQGETSGVSSWRGIFINTDEKVSNFDFVEINDAGNGVSFTQFLNINAAVTNGGNMRMSNTTISNSGGYGVYSVSEFRTPTILEFEDNRIEECKDAPIVIRAEMVENLDLGSCEFEENGLNMVTFPKDACIFKQKTVLKNIGVSYYFEDDVEVLDELTVEAGVDVKMGSGTYFATNIGSGKIVLSGSSTNRVSVSGLENQAGYWKGFYIVSDENNVFENVDISDGGSSAAGFNDNLGNITLEYAGLLTTINCTSSRSNSSCDVVLSDFGGVPTLTDTDSNFAVCTE